MSHIDFDPEPYVDRALTSFIKKMYTIEGTLTLHRHSLSTNNCNILLRRDGVSAYVIKIYSEVVRTEQITLANSIHAYLWDNPEIGSPTILPNMLGECVTIYKKKSLILSVYLEGRSKISLGRDGPQMARGLAIFHTECMRFLDLSHSLQVPGGIMVSSCDESIMRFFLENGYTLVAQILRLVRLRIGKDQDSFQQGIIHGQYGSGNLSFGEKLYIFDFEEVGHGPILMDLLYGAYNCGYRDQEVPSIDGIFTFLGYYMDHYTLNRYEKRNILDGLILCFITDLYIMLHEKARPGIKGYSSAMIARCYQDLIGLYKNMDSYTKQYLK